MGVAFSHDILAEFNITFRSRLESRSHIGIRPNFWLGRKKLACFLGSPTLGLVLHIFQHPGIMLFRLTRRLQSDIAFCIQYAKCHPGKVVMAASAHLRTAKGYTSKASARRRLVNLGAEHANLDQKAYQILKTMIIERQLLPGEKIAQEKLAEDLGISRTPLVNALKFLEKEKLVQCIPRRGFFVRLFSKHEMISIFELREVLEGLAARRAAQNISEKEIKELRGHFRQFAGVREKSDNKTYAREDRRFHEFLLNIGAKEFLKSILETYNIMSFSYQTVSAEGLVRPPYETIHEHLAIIDAIGKRDAESAERLMRQHLSNSAAVLRRSVGKG